jgi:hypothetical protein
MRYIIKGTYLLCEEEIGGKLPIFCGANLKNKMA